MIGNKNTKNKQNSSNHFQLAFLLHVCPKDKNSKKKLTVTIKMTDFACWAGEWKVITDSHSCNRFISIYAISHTV